MGTPAAGWATKAKKRPAYPVFFSFRAFHPAAGSHPFCFENVCFALSAAFRRTNYIKRNLF